MVAWLLRAVGGTGAGAADGPLEAMGGAEAVVGMMPALGELLKSMRPEGRMEVLQLLEQLLRSPEPFSTKKE